MTKQATVVSCIAVLSLAACSGSGTVPAPAAHSASTASRTTQSIVTKGYFSEYSLPSGINPSDLVRGPYNTVWFTHPGASGAPPAVYQMTDGTGQVHAFTAPSPYESAGFDSIISLNSSVYFILKQPVNEDTFYFARVTSAGAFSFTQAPYFEYGNVTNLALVPTGTTFTYGYCVDPCEGAGSGIAAGAALGDYFVASNLTGGPGGYLYVTAICHGPCDPSVSNSRVYVVSSAGSIVHKFTLPNGADPAGIVTGSDHNLWITEPGINKIARMTPTGSFTQFSIPTANAQPDRITYGYDTAQYFTETAANKIGRISTSGGITEYAIPTASSHPTGIAPCESNCGSHGGVWFTETAANKVGRFNAPI